MNTLNRRGFLGALLAAPAIVKAENIMRIWVPPVPKVVSYWDYPVSAWGGHLIYTDQFGVVRTAPFGRGGSILIPSGALNVKSITINCSGRIPPSTNVLWNPR